MATEIVLRSPWEDLTDQIERDPDGHYWVSIAGDRRLPPWYASEEASAAPENVREVVRSFIEGIAGLNPEHFEVRHNWYASTFDFVRWLPEFEEQSDQIALVTWAPIELDSWPAELGWTHLGPPLLAHWWRSFVHSGADLSDDEKKAREIRDAKREAMMLAQKVAQAAATPEEIERYEAALNVIEPQGDAEFRDAAAYYRDAIRRQLKELGL